MKILIMSCLRNIKYIPLVNGKECDPFFPSKGIRQGDPISPYIFIMSMELITYLINEKKNPQKAGHHLALKTKTKAFHTYYLLMIFFCLENQIQKI